MEIDIVVAVSLVLGSASLFGLIVGIFSVYNGRATRRLIVEEEKRTQEILDGIKDTQNRSIEILNRVSKTLDGVKETSDRSIEMLNKVRETSDRSIEMLNRNTEILDKIASRIF